MNALPFLLLCLHTAPPPPVEVPAGYTVQIAAEAPLVTHPIMAGFDDRGRLYVAQSAGLNLARKDLEEQLPNFISRLEDTDGDGKFDKSTLFADNLTFPQGALWHDGALFVASSGGVWKFQDLDDDGVAEHREQLVAGFGYTGNAADVHGCFLHPDGRIYWVQGRHGHEVRDAEGNLVSKSKAGGVFSIRPDGSGFHRHATGGFDNPVELIFTEEGEPLGTVNLFEYPPRQDCLVHWVEGGLYPRRDFVGEMDEFVSTGPLLPAVHSFGHAAVSGLTRSKSDHLGFRGDVFVTLFNTHEVVRVELQRSGSTFEATPEPFLRSSQPDFHPTDVLEDADGSLLVIDTGGWFVIGCPTSQAAKPQVMGAIYRVRKDDGPTLDDPRGLKLAWDDAEPGEVAQRLGDPRFAVRERAVEELRKRGGTALPALHAVLRGAKDAQARRNAAWALIRMGDKPATREALLDTDPSVRQVAAHGAGLLRDGDAVETLSGMVLTDSPQVRREAAAALGLIGRAAAVPALLTAMVAAEDRMLDHAITDALIRINDPALTAEGLAAEHPATRRAALIALDRMASGDLTPERVLGLFGSGADTELRRAVMEIITKRPGWSVHAVELFRRFAVKDRLEEGEGDRVRELLTAISREPGVAEQVGAKLDDPALSEEWRALLMLSIAQWEPFEAPASVVDSLLRSLASGEEEGLTLGVRATEKARAPALNVRLRELVADTRAGNGVRIAAVRALTAQGHPLDDAGFDVLLTALDPRQTLDTRREASLLIVKNRPEGARLDGVIEAVATAGPIELPILLDAFKEASGREVGSRLFVALAASTGLSAVRVEVLETLAERFGPETVEGARPLLDRLRAESEGQRSRVDELERSLTTGSAERGKALFISKATCFACHRVRGEGSLIGPDLSGIGAIRARRDLLEAIAFPSASFARGYEPMTVTMGSGEALFGRISGESVDVLTLTDPAGTEHRLVRSKIKEITPAAASLMPAGLDRLLSPEELSDLVAYLQGLR